jgi:putative colanic acid biosynthesis UDP-glucose lipid carrier transferase
MFEDRSYKRTFYSAPQSVQSLIAAFLEPGLIVAVLLAALAWCDEPVARPVYVLCLLVFALTFPGATASAAPAECRHPTSCWILADAAG